MLQSPHAAPAAIPGYNLTPPGESDALAAVQRVYGEEKGGELWKSACHAARVPPGWVRSRDTLERVLGALGEQGGPQGVIARSMEIRLRTYDRLAARAGGGTR
jgi:hypothetical protein